MNAAASESGWTPRRRRLAAVLGAFVALQFVPVERANPEVRQVPDAPEAGLTVLRQHCFDCHSHETRWPWYARIAPTSWLVARDVARGREHLNFSRWSDMTAVEQRNARSAVADAVARGDMPPRQYYFNPTRSRPDPAELAALRSWADAAAPSARAPHPTSTNPR